jgi:hypothetical protein
MGRFKTYRDGQIVQTSGRYAALHSTPHKLVERSTYVEGDLSHRCPTCPLGVIYRLEQPIAPSGTGLKAFGEGFALWPVTARISAAFRRLEGSAARFSDAAVEKFAGGSFTFVPQH